MQGIHVIIKLAEVPGVARRKKLNFEDKEMIFEKRSNIFAFVTLRAPVGSFKNVGPFGPAV